MSRSCPNCDEPLSSREVRCPECGWIFAFYGSSATSDEEWCQLIDELSDQERLYFTTNQLFIHWQRHRVKQLEGALAQAYLSLPIFIASGASSSKFILVVNCLICTILAIPLVGRLCAPLLFWGWFRALIHLIFWSALLSSPWWFTLQPETLPPLLLCFVALIDALRRRRGLSKRAFMEQLQRWKRFHPLSQLLLEPQLHRPHIELQGEALYDYEIDAVLIVDQDLTVDLLTKNGLIKERPILLLSLNGYPEYSSQFAKRLLTLKEEVNVYLLHRDGRDVGKVLKSLRSLGVKRHRIIHLGWGKRSRAQLIDHLGFRPREWDAFAVDSLPPESLSEGLPIAIEEELPLVEVLGPRLRLHI